LKRVQKEQVQRLKKIIKKDIKKLSINKPSKRRKKVVKKLSNKLHKVIQEIVERGQSKWSQFRILERGQ
jgi:transcriptional regulator of heat shock response